MTAVVPAVALARESLPELRGEIFGDGPDRPEVLRQIAESGLDDVVEAPGFVSQERIEHCHRRRSACSSGPAARATALIVVEAAARGVPSIVVAGPTMRRRELVEEGRQRVREHVRKRPLTLWSAISAAPLPPEARSAVPHGEWFARRKPCQLSIEASMSVIADACRGK